MILDVYTQAISRVKQAAKRQFWRWSFLLNEFQHQRKCSQKGVPRSSRKRMNPLPRNFGF
jgi:hypothetical protein